MHACVKVSLSMKCQQPRNYSGDSSSLASVSLLWGQLSELPSQLSLLRGGGHGNSHQVKQEDKFKLSLPNISTKQQQKEALSSTWFLRCEESWKPWVVLFFNRISVITVSQGPYTQDGSAACPPEAAGEARRLDDEWQDRTWH